MRLCACQPYALSRALQPFFLSSAFKAYTVIWQSCFLLLVDWEYSGCLWRNAGHMEGFSLRGGRQDHVMCWVSKHYAQPAACTTVLRSRFPKLLWPQGVQPPALTRTDFSPISDTCWRILGAEPPRCSPGNVYPVQKWHWVSILWVKSCLTCSQNTDTLWSISTRDLV